jgi:hypothetical protein
MTVGGGRLTAEEHELRAAYQVVEAAPTRRLGGSDVTVQTTAKPVRRLDDWVGLASRNTIIAKY